MRSFHSLINNNHRHVFRADNHYQNDKGQHSPSFHFSIQSQCAPDNQDYVPNDMALDFRPLMEGLIMNDLMSRVVTVLIFALVSSKATTTPQDAYISVIMLTVFAIYFSQAKKL